jgi:hypothetical protein
MNPAQQNTNHQKRSTEKPWQQHRGFPLVGEGPDAQLLLADAP